MSTWISVTDRLPEVGVFNYKEFLVALKFYDNEKTCFTASIAALYLNEVHVGNNQEDEISTGWFTNEIDRYGESFFDEVNTNCSKVTHWQPIPEPPADAETPSANPLENGVDARILSAAPEMFAILKKILGECRSYNSKKSILIRALFEKIDRKKS